MITTDTIKLLLGILSGISALIVTILLVAAEENIRYFIRRYVPGESRRGAPPRPRSKAFWGILSFFALFSVLLGALSASIESDKPSIPVTEIPIATNPVPTLTPLPSATATPVSIPMEFLKLNIVNTGVKGQICGYSKISSIVRDLDQNLHVFFVTAENPTTVFESISTDGGKTWLPPDFVAGFTVEGQHLGLTCAAALDPFGNIHLFFDLTASDIGYTIWSPASGWKRPVIRGQGLPDVGNFAVNLATGRENQVHAIWSSKKLWYTFFDGKGWSSELQVAPGGWHPDIFVDNNNVRHVVYNDAGFIPDKSGDGYSFVTVYYTSSDDGEHWSAEKVIPPDDGVWKGDAAITVDEAGRRHVTYIEWATLEGDLYYTYSDDGQAWSQPEVINTEPGVVTGSDGNESAAMLLDMNGNLYVVWQALELGGNPGNKLMMRWLNKTTQQWSNPIEIAKIPGGIGDQPSMPYRVYGWEDRNSFVVDIVWTSAGEIYYGQVKFQAIP